MEAHQYAPLKFHPLRCQCSRVVVWNAHVAVRVLFYHVVSFIDPETPLRLQHGQISGKNKV